MIIWGLLHDVWFFPMTIYFQWNVKFYKFEQSICINIIVINYERIKKIMYCSKWWDSVKYYWYLFNLGLFRRIELSFGGYIYSYWIGIIIGISLSPSTATTYNRQQRKRLEEESHEAVTSATAPAAIQVIILPGDIKYGTTHEAMCTNRSTITNDNVNGRGSWRSKAAMTQDKNLDDRYIRQMLHKLECNIEYGYSFNAFVWFRCNCVHWEFKLFRSVW